MNNLSILIPTYNTVCVELVKELQRQAETADCKYEIIVADDGSTDISTVEANKRINDLPCCTYIIRCKNEGRARIRNFLSRQAQYDRLLFIDSDMVVRSEDYIRKYVDCTDCPVVYGGYVINGNAASLKNNLRYIYECKNKRNGSAAERNKQPYNDFHTSNFLVRRSLFLAYPLDERFRKYGYEDVVWGKTLKQNGIHICHIDNSLSFETFETNGEFISKTEESLRTLHTFKDELKGYSTILEYAEKIERLRLSRFFSWLFSLFSKTLKKRLSDNKPSVLLFNIYKLLYFFHL